MNNFKNKDRGFVTAIIVIIIALVALKYAFHFDIVDFLKTPKVHDLIIKILAFIEKVGFWLKSAFDWLLYTAQHFFKK